MALSDLFSLVDDKLRSVFEKVSYDPSRDRTKFAARIEATKTKFLATEPPKGRKDFTVANNTVRYTPTLNGKPVTLNARTELFVPAERFSDFLDGLKREVEAGSLDKEIEAANEGTEIGETAPTPARKPRQKREGGGSGWSEERRAKFAQTVAARKAAKG